MTLRTLVLLAGWLIVSGCATKAPPVPLPAPLRDAAYAAPSAPLPSAQALFALSPEMHRFALAQLGSLAPSRDLRQELVDALYRSHERGRPGLRLSYDASRTRSAAEAFEARAGNCLSLVMMTAAFARHLGLAVSYQAVNIDEHYSSAGNLTFASGHVNLMLSARPKRPPLAGVDPDALVVDFLAPMELHGQRSQPVAEATLVAMYFNNRAAELLAEGRLDDAYWHARESLLHDPSFLNAINTLGVIHQRAGQLQAAEASFRLVLRQDARAAAALSNLVELLRANGRADEAMPLATRLAEIQPHPPLHWLRQGRAALAAGEPGRAIDLLRRELRRQPDLDEVHFALAEALLRLGEVGSAQRHLALAAQFSLRSSDQRRYEAKLTRLRSTLGGTAPASALQ